MQGTVKHNLLGGCNKPICQDAKRSFLMYSACKTENESCCNKEIISIWCWNAWESPRESRSLTQSLKFEFIQVGELAGVHWIQKIQVGVFVWSWFQIEKEWDEGRSQSRDGWRWNTVFNIQEQICVCIWVHNLAVLWSRSPVFFFFFFFFSSFQSRLDWRESATYFPKPIHLIPLLTLCHLNTFIMVLEQWLPS